MSRKLDDLDPRFRPLAVELLARTVEAGIVVLIVDTRRTLEEHQANVKAGRSWVARSKHCDGLAIDIVPYTVWDAHGPDKLNWDAGDPVWQKLGALGEAAGCRWGGRWKHGHTDLGHFELPDADIGTRA
ncbi:MAG: M15 family metallopeptidase [Rhodospirillaceae bacterium]